jgi:hypothetical protein
MVHAAPFRFSLSRYFLAVNPDFRAAWCGATGERAVAAETAPVGVQARPRNAGCRSKPSLIGS